MVVSKDGELHDYTVSEFEWRVASKVCTFLEAAASATKHQSGSLYVTLSLVFQIFEKLEQICRHKMQESKGVVGTMAESMLNKLRKFDPLVNTTVERLARVMDHRFRTNILLDGDILRAFVEIDPGLSTVVERERDATKRLYMEELAEENTADLDGDNEFTRYLRAATNSDKGAVLLLW